MLFLICASGELVAGDHIYFKTAEESRNYVLTTEMLRQDVPSPC